jgi:hypothetical protein
MTFGKPSTLAEEFGYLFASFYLQKNNGDYEAAAKEVTKLRITKIEAPFVDKVIIYTARPGLLIGRRGINIAALHEFTKCKIDIREAFCWDDILVPVSYEDIENL